MARVTPIAEIFDLNADEPVMIVRGTLTKVYQNRTGTNAHGEWSIQGAMLKDSTGEIKIMFKDRQHVIPDTWRGREIVLESTNGSHGWKGLTAFDDVYNGKTTRVLKVTGTASVGLADESGQDDTPPPQQQRKQAPAPAPAPARRQQDAPPQQQQQRQEPPPQRQQQQPPNAEDAAAKAAHDLKEVKRRIVQDANLYAQCFGAVVSIIAPQMSAHGLDIDPIGAQKITTVLFIQAQRRDDAKFMPRSPTAPKSKDTPPPARDPDPAPRQPAPAPAPAPTPSQRAAAAATYTPEEEEDDIPF
jgi:hypothetical protein